MPFVAPPTTPTPEAIILDPVEENTGSPLTISTGSYGLLEHSYPAPPLSAQWAASVDTEGAQLASRKHDNREITYRIDCATTAALSNLQQKIAKLYREGGTLKRTLPNGWSIVYDVLTVANFDPSFDHAFDLGDLSTVPITLVCEPYGRVAEVDLGDNVETSLPVLRFTESAVAGDVEALGRLVIDNDDAANGKGLLIWGLRSRDYSSASTAALFYEAESCAMLTATPAVGTAPVSGSGNTVARKLNVGTTPGSALIYVGTSSTAQTHVGTYRVFARAYSPGTNTGTMSVWLQWAKTAAGWLDEQITNDAAVLPPSVAGSWVLADLGMISIPEATNGSQGWLGSISASSTVAGDDIDLDCVILIPAAEGYAFAHSDSGQGVIGGPFTGGGQAVIRHNSAERSIGSYWVSISNYEGDYLLVPPSGAEEHTLEMVVLLADGALPGTNYYGHALIGDLSARLYVTPRYLVVPS